MLTPAACGLLNLAAKAVVLLLASLATAVTLTVSRLVESSMVTMAPAASMPAPGATGVVRLIVATPGDGTGLAVVVTAAAVLAIVKADRSNTANMWCRRFWALSLPSSWPNRGGVVVLS